MRADVRLWVRSVIAIALVCLTSSGSAARAQSDGDLVQAPGFPSERSAPRPERVSSEQVSAMFAEHRPELLACTTGERGNAEALQRSRHFQVTIDITTSGRVRSVSVRGSRRVRVAACVERTVHAWRFPASQRGGEVTHALLL